MRIYCKNCQTGYEIDPTLIPAEGKKVRCSHCGIVFMITPADLVPDPEVMSVQRVEETATNETREAFVAEAEKAEAISEESANAETVSEEEGPKADTDELKGMFERLSASTEDLFNAENELPMHRKLGLKLKRMLGLTNRFNRYLWLVGILSVLGLAAYNYRYEIVRTIPSLNTVYKMFNIKATIPGEGLAFRNITWNRYEEDYVGKLEVKGFVSNPTQREIELPVIKVVLLDADGTELQSLNQVPSIAALKPGSRVAVSVTIKKPSPLTKYVLLTFVERK